MTITQGSTTQYFKNIASALIEAGVHSPTLVIDKQRLDQNIEHFLSVTRRGFDIRLVAKSLPSIPMLHYIMDRVGTNRLMSFHLPFLRHLVTHIPHSDILLGKPMPAAGAHEFYRWHNQLTTSDFNPQQQLHWLVDNNERLLQYQALAASMKTEININLEIDVGLHRGGYICQDAFKQALTLVKNDRYLTLSGLMGYEAHVTKVPAIVGGPKKAFVQAMASYQRCVDSVAEIFGPQQLTQMILNAGGSTTYPLYDKPGLVNEIATASALVKPTDFDVFTLDHHQPAAFIATPVLKMVDKPELPMAPALSSLLRTLDLLPKKACFIYGGNWLATPCFPADSKRADILGHSSNQEMFELASDSEVAMDDFFFFRPTQSESVFLQFGKLAIVDEGNITDWWSVFEAQQR